MVMLIDSSCWVHQLRRLGDPVVRDRVEASLRAGEAAWCAPVRLELWMGVRNDGERRVLQTYEDTLPDLAITPEVWQRACRLAETCRRKGKTVPAMDALIVACALHHRVELMYADAHFEHLLAT